MNTYPKALRLLLGLSLTHFSELISCSASHLSMAESGLRKLPDFSMEALNNLEKALEQTTAKSRPLFTESKKAAVLAKQVVKKNTVLLRKHKMGLEQLSHKMKQAKLLFQLSIAFEQKPFIADDGITHLRMKILKRVAAKKLDEYSAALLQQKLAIAGLEAKIKLASDF
jgi:transcriptional regulator with XRE-family HTH domain